MLTIRQLFRYAQLAQASYANLTFGLTEQEILAALAAGDFAPSLAEDFIGSGGFNIIQQLPNTADGFSATVFQDKTSNDYVLAIRGTEIATIPDLTTDFADIGADGIAIDQAIDLFNYYQDLKAEIDSTVYHYHYDQSTGQVTYTSSIALSTGALFGRNFSVTGHSLGGHLALIMSRLAPDRVTAVNTFNPAGFDPLGSSPGAQAFFDALRQAEIAATGTSNIAASFDVTKITNVAVPDDVVHLIGNVPGGFLPQFTEGSNSLNNHFIDGMTDSLAAYELLELLDPSKSASEILALGTDIFKAASLSVGMSLENAISAFSDLLRDGSALTSDNRNLLHARISDLRAFVLDPQTGVLKAHFQGLSLASLVHMTSADLVTAAANSLGYRYALAELNPFVVLGSDALYNAPVREGERPHNDAGSLELFSAEARSGALTSQYIADRSAFLAIKNQIYASDIPVIVPGQTDNWRYFDIPRNVDVLSPGSAPASIQRHVVFGGDGAERVAGGGQADKLYGGAGTDYLVGYGGNDYQEGGRGLDLYRFAANERLTFEGLVLENDGADEILDIDGAGLLRYVYTPLFGSAQSAVIVDTSIKVNDTTWQSADGKFTFNKQGVDLVVTVNVNGGGSLTLRDFRDGDFGIYLWSERTEPTTGRTLEGDRRPEDGDPVTAGDQLVYDSWGNILTTAEIVEDRHDALFGRDDSVGDLIIAGGGNDILLGDTPMMVSPGPRLGFDPLQTGGNDWLQADSGRDFVDGGPGDDLVEGGFGGLAAGDAGGDVIQGGLGNDTLYGDFRIDVGLAIRNGETDPTSTGKGDFVSGGAGDDRLIGSAARDVLMGGGGKDVLIGGAGDDTIRGDDGQTATTLAWTVTNTVTSEGGQTVYLSSITGSNFVDFSEGGADAIYGGQGSDWIFAEAGADFIDGGSHNDVLFGGFGPDIILGGTGLDVIVGDEGGAANSAEGGDYLDGGDENDTIFGNGGDDILVGGRDNDRLVGGAGKDVYVYEKGDGRDTIDDSDTAGSATSVLHLGGGLARQDVKFGVGSLAIRFGSEDEIHVEGFDYVNPTNTPLVELHFDDGQVMTYADILAQGFDIDGTSNPDLITGTGVTDRIRGLEGNDTLIALDGDDFLYGGSGSDMLHGGAGNDYLEGGDGYDLLNGGAGDDTYIYDTFDTITDSQGLNRIVFGEGIAPENLSVSSAVVGGQPQLLIARPGAAGPGLEIRSTSLTSSNFLYVFADGQTLTQQEFIQIAYNNAQTVTATAGGETLLGYAGNDTLNAGAGDDTLSGGAGHDTLNGNSGNDVVFGGTGNDTLIGEDGDDTFYGDAGDDRIFAHTGNDLLVGGAGDDLLIGGHGADTYLFGYGDGNDFIDEGGDNASDTFDTLRIADGISLADVTVARESSGDLSVTLNATQERAVISGWYLSAADHGFPPFSVPLSAFRVERIVFGDGTQLGVAELEGLTVQPIFGTAGNDAVEGTRYEDTLQGLAGADTLDGGLANDLVIGGEGSDTYVLRWMMGRDTVIESAGETSTIKLMAGMSLDDVVATRDGDDLFVHTRRTDHGFLIKDYYTQAHIWHLETAGGASLPLADFIAAPAPTTGDPVLDLWEARKTQFKADWYGFNSDAPASPVLLSDGTIYSAPGPTVGGPIGSRVYLNGERSGTGGDSGTATGATESYNSFGSDIVITSDAASQFHNTSNVSTVNTTAPATFTVTWDEPSVTRSTTYQGTVVGFDLQLHSLYQTVMVYSTSGTVQDIVRGTSDGASGTAVVDALYSNAALPTVVNGTIHTSTSTFSPVIVIGGASANVIESRSTGMVDGGAGNDIIDAVGAGMFSTAGGGSFLYGGSGNDGITGSGSGDLIAGGPGSDRLAGWSGDDTFYFFASDTGIDVVNEVTWYLWDTFNGQGPSGTALFNADSGRLSEDTVEFGAGIALEDLTLSWGAYETRYWTTPSLLKTYDTLDILWAPDKGVRVLMPDPFDVDVRKDMTIHSPGASWGIEHFKFANGTQLSMQDMLDRMPAQVFTGTAGDDVLAGGPGNNEFSGGAGFDHLFGAFGADTYHFNVGDGDDAIHDAGGNDTVVFGAGITQEMLTLASGSLLIRVGAGGDQLRIDYFDVNNALGTGQIETYRFADGTSLTHAELLERGFDFSGSNNAETLSGTSVGDRILGLGGNDTLNGGDGADVLEGGEGNDTLIGGSGADTLLGGAGDDVYFLDGADVFSENPGEGTDLIQAGVTFTLPENIENLTLTEPLSINGTGNALNNVLTGNSSSNVLFGLEGADTLSGGGGNDVLDGGAGADGMAGGQGDDAYIVDDAGDVVIESAGQGTDLVHSSITYTLTTNVENLVLTGTADINGTGNSAANVITGNAGANVLSGDLGNDTLDGGSGADTMVGGLGNDSYVVEELGDVVVENPSEGTDLVRSSIAYVLGENLENLVLTGAGEINGTGNALNNTITGNSGANVLSGLDGDDTLSGGGGADQLVGGTGNDAYIVSSGEVLIIENEGEGTDLVQAGITHVLGQNLENLTLTGTDSLDGTGNELNNSITGNAGANWLYGLGGDDTLNGGADADVMLGGRGNDTYVVDHPSDLVIEQPNDGIDLVLSSISYTLGLNVENLTITGSGASNGTGNELANVITGNLGNNVLAGLGGNDTLVGNSGNDTLDGGTGADAMTGNAGNDTFIVDDFGDVVTEVAGQGTDVVLTSITYTLGADVENLTLTGTAAINGTGNSANNVLTGNSGVNVLSGLAGGDTYVMDNTDDVIVENLNEGIDLVQASVSYTLGANIENLTLTGGASINATGNELNNTLTGNVSHNVLAGLGGNDTLIGSFGNDTLDGGTGADAMTGNAGNDMYVVDDLGDVVTESSGQGTDTVQASVTYTLGANVENLLLAGTADINGTGNTLNNTLTGNSADNILDGSAGGDIMAGGTGNDVYLVDNAADVVSEDAAAGTDRVNSSISYTLGENVENLTLTGTGSINGSGNALANVLTGNAGGNILDGGAGDDVLSGGEGSDSYRFGIGAGADSVQEVDATENDTDSILLGAGITTANLLGARSGEDLVLSVDGTTDQLTIIDWFSAPGNRIDRAQFADGTVWDAATLEALAVPPNSAPTLQSGIADQEAIEDTEFLFTIPIDTISDADAGDTLTYSASLADGSALPGWLVFNPTTRTLSGTPLNEHVGLIDVRITATDTFDESASDVFTVTVGNTNDAPVVAAPFADQSASEDSPFSFTVPANAFTDVDVGDSIAYSATLADGSALPAWLVFEAATRTFSGTPANADVGSFDIKVTATDSSSASASDIFTVTVANTNDAPTVANPIEDQTATETFAFSFTVPADAFSDVDTGDALTYAATLADGSPLPGWLDFDPISRTFSGTPANANIGILDVKVTATDAAGASSYDVFSLTVARDNHAPVLAQALSDQLATETQALSFAVPASAFADPDSGDTLTLSAALASGAALPSWLAFDSATRTFTGTPPDTAADVYTIRVTATDTGGATVFDDFLLDVANLVNGTAGADTLTGTAGRDFLFGLGGSDTLSGLAGNDYLDGGTGSDSMAGGAGNDTYVVDATGDTVIENAGEGIDTVHSSISLTLGANVENLILTGTAAINGTGNSLNNILTGNGAANTLTGGGGDDWLDGGDGSDTMAGGAGNDTYVVGVATDVVTEGSNAGIDTVQSSVTLTLGNNVENLTLTGTAAINGTGNSANNVLRGDTNSAANTLTGGAGNDTYVLGVGDTVVEASNKGTDTVETSISYTLAANVENLVLTGAAAINGTGNTLANVMTGNSAANILDGGAGTDNMAGGLGDDTYIVDAAGDVVTENIGEGTDTVQTALSYTVGTNVENLTLTGANAVNGTGNALDNVLTGNSAVNMLNGEAGNDTLDGGAAADTLSGGAGDDIYYVDNAGDSISESFPDGIDEVRSSVTYTIGLYVENLTLVGTAAINATGNSLNNILTGNSAANTLTAGAGHDTLDGGEGADILVGGQGNDTYIVDASSDVVTELVNEGTDVVHSSITYTLSANVEELLLTGTASIDGAGDDLDNRLVGNAGSNTLSGGMGADSLDGRGGGDTLIGGLGNDQYYVYDANDVLIEVAGEGTDHVWSYTNTYTLSANVEDVIFLVEGAIVGIGNDGDNRMVVWNDANNSLTGGLGNDNLDAGWGNSDVMIGGLGDDFYYVDLGDTVVEYAGEGSDTVYFYSIDQSYVLADDLENLILADGAVNGTGNAAANSLQGNYGNNVLDGGAGADWLYGSLGDDTYVIDNVGDEILEFPGEGTDTVLSSISFAFPLLAVENLVLTGTAVIDGTGNNLNNLMTGNEAGNVLTSSGGNDRLDGKGGADTLIGGTGNDTYVLGRGYGSEIVQENDSTAGNTDVAEFLSGVATDQIWFRQSGNSLEVSIIGTADQFTMQDWYLGAQYRVEQFRTATADSLLESQVQNLVDAMAAFAPPAPGQMTLPPEYASELTPVIAANWQ